jgi:hypothetical protein
VTDKNGVPVTRGTRVRAYDPTRHLVFEGTVRTVRNDGHLARVDDGDPANPDTSTNGSTVVKWLTSDEMEVLL